MAFKFSLATLLRLREIAEQREERLLGQIQNQIVQSRQNLDGLAKQRASVIQQREQALVQSASAVDLLESYGRVSAIETLEKAGREQLAKLITLCDQQMKIYQTAHRNLELLSGMRDDQREVFEKEKVKQEQSMMDDNFASRLNFK